MKLVGMSCEACWYVLCHEICWFLRRWISRSLKRLRLLSARNLRSGVMIPVLAGAARNSRSAAVVVEAPVAR